MDLSGETMGTTWSARALVPDGITKADLNDAVTGTHQAVIDVFSTWNAGSFISRFNTAPAGTCFTPDAAFQTVWNEAVRIADLTNGAFNPAHGAETRARGFGPTGTSLTAFTARHSWTGDPITRPDGQIRQPGGLELDLSAIAKGYGVDEMARALLALNVPSFLVEIGGEFYGHGIRADGQPWWIDLQSPDLDRSAWRVAACGIAIATSGNLYKSRHGRSHIIGAPTHDRIQTSISVFASSVMLADAWATALYAAGDDALTLANAHDIAALFQSAGQPPRHSEALKAYFD